MQRAYRKGTTYEAVYIRDDNWLGLRGCGMKGFWRDWWWLIVIMAVGCAATTAMTFWQRHDALVSGYEHERLACERLTDVLGEDGSRPNSVMANFLIEHEHRRGYTCQDVLDSGGR